MHIAVIGATGRSGRAFSQHAQHSGHEVTAVVRDRRRLRGLTPASVVEAERWDQELLSSAMSGTGAVAFCVGPVKGGSTTIQQDLIGPTIAAMQAAGARRLIAISASGGVVDGDDPMGRYLAKPILRRVLHTSFADMAAMEARIRASDREWTIVRPPMLTDRRGTGRYRSRREGNVRWHYSIAREDLARAMLDLIVDPSAIGATVSVAGGGREHVLA